MTVATEAYFGQVVWNGEPTFNPGFSCEKMADVHGLATSPSLVDTPLSQGVHYTVLLGANGAVTIQFKQPGMVPPPTLVTFWRDTDALQGVNFQDLEDFSADDHEMLHDRWARITGELKGDVARAPKAPFGEIMKDLPTHFDRMGPTGEGTFFAFRGADGQPEVVSRLDFIPDGSVTTIKLADGAVTTPKLADQAVTNQKIHDADVNQLGINLRTKAQWASPFLAMWGTNGSGITDLFTVGPGIAIDAFALTVGIPPLGITTGMLANNAVTHAKIADASIDNNKIQDHSVRLGTKAASEGANKLWATDDAGLTDVVTPGDGLVVDDGVLQAPGFVHAAPPTSFNQLAGFADPPDGTLIQGIDLPPAGLKRIGPVLALANDLAALEAATGTNTIYYRSAVDTWSPVTVGAGLTFAGGTLSAGALGTGSVNTSGPVTASQLAGYADATGNVIRGVTVGAGLLLAGGTNLSVVLGAGGAQPFDADLTSLAAASATSAIYYRSAADTWAPVTIGANLTFSGGILSATGAGGGGTGTVNTAGSVTSAMLTGYADATGTLIKGINVGTGLDLASNTLSAVLGAGGAQPFDAELAALAGLSSGIDQLPYFTGAGTATLTTLTTFGRSLIDDADAAAARTTLGIDLTAFQPLDGDLSSLAAALGTNTIYYRSGADTWSPVAIGSNLTFTGGTLSATVTGGGGGSVNTSGPVTGTDLAGFADGSGNLIKSVLVGSSLLYDGTTLSARLGVGGAQAFDAELAAIAALTSAADQLPYFTGAGTAALTTLSGFARTLIDDADAAAARTTLGIAANFQPLDADLTSLAAAAGTNTIYYRSAADTWSPVTIGSGLTFTGGTLTSTAAGDVTQAGNNAFTGTNTFTGPALVYGHTAAIDAASYKVQTHGTHIGVFTWSNDANAFGYHISKSRGATPGTHVAVQSADLLGQINFRGSDGTVFQVGASIQSFVDAAVVAGQMPARLAFFTKTTTALVERMRIDSVGRVLVGDAAGVQSGLLLQVNALAGMNAGIWVGNWQNAAGSPFLNLAHSRGATAGTHVALQANDPLGTIQFQGSDGTGFVIGASIQAMATAAPSSNNVPTALRFLTMPTGGVLQEQWRIAPGGGLMAVGISVDPPQGQIALRAAVLRQASDAPGQGAVWYNAAASNQIYAYAEGNNLWFNGSSGSQSFNFAVGGDVANPVMQVRGGGVVIKGTTTNDDAGAGMVGQYLEGVRTTSLSFTASAVTEVASISLTAGDWEVSGYIGFTMTGTAALCEIDINSSVAFAATPRSYATVSTVTVANVPLWTPMFRVSLAAPTTMRLIARVNISGCSTTAASIRARRVR